MSGAPNLFDPDLVMSVIYQLYISYISVIYKQPDQAQIIAGCKRKIRAPFRILAKLSEKRNDREERRYV